MATAQIFVKGLFIGRYWGDYGSQHEFYVMESLLQEGTNTLVLAVYTTSEGPFTLEVLHYYIELASGNINEEGPAFASQEFVVKLN